MEKEPNKTKKKQEQGIKKIGSSRKQEDSSRN